MKYSEFFAQIRSRTKDVADGAGEKVLSSAIGRFTLAGLRDIYAAALGYGVSVTNLQRVLVRRGQLEPTGEISATGPQGGRPARLFRFTDQSLTITDPFAVLRP